MKAVFILSVFVIVLSSVLGRPVDVEGPDCAPITSLLEGNLILRDVAVSDVVACMVWSCMFHVAIHRTVLV